MPSYYRSIPDNKSSPSGNIYDKYHTKNPVYKAIVDRFLRTLKNIVLDMRQARTILEVGCGEGYLCNYVRSLRDFSRVEGVDVSGEIIALARSRYPDISFSVNSVYDLRYGNSAFDVVMACELLEHLADYDKALQEIYRITKRYCILSVPVEPLWRILNLARGAYVARLGNTPGHLQHWGKKAFRELASKYFVIKDLYYPIPWQIAVGEKRQA